MEMVGKKENKDTKKVKVINKLLKQRCFPCKVTSEYGLVRLKCGSNPPSAARKRSLIKCEKIFDFYN